MPIHIDEVDTQVEVQTSESPRQPARLEAPKEALHRWQELSRREAEVRARTLAWGFDD
jgi:hypothetical protein